MSSIETDAEVFYLIVHSGRRTAQFVRNFLASRPQEHRKIISRLMAPLLLSSSIKRQK
jgi:hypothetical protein